MTSRRASCCCGASWDGGCGGLGQASGYFAHCFGANDANWPRRCNIYGSCTTSQISNNAECSGAYQVVDAHFSWQAQGVLRRWNQNDDGTPSGDGGQFGVDRYVCSGTMTSQFEIVTSSYCDMDQSCTSFVETARTTGSWSSSVSGRLGCGVYRIQQGTCCNDYGGGCTAYAGWSYALGGSDPNASYLSELLNCACNPEQTGEPCVQAIPIGVYHGVGCQARGGCSLNQQDFICGSVENGCAQGHFGSCSNSFVQAVVGNCFRELYGTTYANTGSSNIVFP